MTLEDFIQEYSDVIGYNLNDKCGAITRINRAREVIYPLGDFLGTMSLVEVNFSSCYRNSQFRNQSFYLPSEIATVRNAWRCGRHVNGSSIEQGPIYPTCCLYSDPSIYCCGPSHLTKTGIERPLPFSINNNSRLGFRLDDASDNQVFIDITYNTSTGSKKSQKIQLTDSEEVFNTEEQVANVISITKPITNSSIGVYEVYSNDTYTKRFNLYFWQKNVKYTLIQASGYFDRILVLSKKRLVRYDEHFLDIEIDINPHALGLLMSAIKSLGSSEGKSVSEYAALVKLAREFLHQEKNDHFIFSSNRGQREPLRPEIPVLPSSCIY